MDIRILIATHKKYWMPKDSVYLPIQVGKAGKQDLGYITDDTGDNISNKNAHYCELTAVYWAWKNLTHDYLGLCHYRRYFGYNEYCENIEKIKSTIFKRADYERILQEYNVILPKRVKIGNKLTIREEYNKNHFGKDLEKIQQIISELYPEYIDSTVKILNSRYIYYFNMFVMQKKLFDSYCEWLFNILFALEKNIDLSSYDTYQTRVFGFLSERLLNIWIEKNNPRIYEADVVLLEPETASIWKKVRYAIKRKYHRLFRM